MQGTRRVSNDAPSRKVNVLLWTVQGILALVFLFAGSMKLVMPLDNLSGPIDLPGWFVRLIGVCEVAGALGLVLPGGFRIRTGLTPLAASGLVIIMVGATTLTAAYMGIASANVPLVVGILAASVAYGRRPRDLGQPASYAPTFQPAG